LASKDRDGEGECYQISAEIEAVYNDKNKCLESLKYKGSDVDNTKFYKICLQGYHINKAKEYLGVSEEELRASGEAKVVSTSIQGVLEEYLKNHQNLSRKIEGRLVYKK